MRKVRVTVEANVGVGKKTGVKICGDFIYMLVQIFHDRINKL
jgi:hypothetical protein